MDACSSVGEPERHFGRVAEALDCLPLGSGRGLTAGDKLLGGAPQVILGLRQQAPAGSPPRAQLPLQAIEIDLDRRYRRHPAPRRTRFTVRENSRHSATLSPTAALPRRVRR